MQQETEKKKQNRKATQDSHHHGLPVVAAMGGYPSPDCSVFLCDVLAPVRFVRDFTI